MAAYFSHRTNLTSNWLAGSAIKRTCIPIGWLGQPSKEPALLLVGWVNIKRTCTPFGWLIQLSNEPELPLAGWVNHQKNLPSYWLAGSIIERVTFKVLGILDFLIQIFCFLYTRVSKVVIFPCTLFLIPLLSENDLSSFLSITCICWPVTEYFLILKATDSPTKNIIYK